MIRKLVDSRWKKAFRLSLDTVRGMEEFVMNRPLSEGETKAYRDGYRDALIHCERVLITCSNHVAKIENESRTRK